MAASPEQPPQPLNPYFIFLPENRARFEKEVPEGANRSLGVAKVAGEKWKALPEGQKKVYLGMAAAEKAAFEAVGGVHQNTKRIAKQRNAKQSNPSRA